MYKIYKNILHSFPGGFKILVKSYRSFRRILWLISWSLQDDQGGITCMLCGPSLELSCKMVPCYSFLSEPLSSFSI